MSVPYQPHISVILAVRNGMPHLKTTLEGLMSQTYRNFTLVVQDGLSTDGSVEYLKSLNTFFPIELVSEADGSMTVGYSRAIKRSKGELVVPAACDEILDANALETYVSWYKEHPDAVFIYGASRLFSGDPTQMLISQIYQPPAFNFMDYLHIRMCPTMAGAYNRRVLGDAFHLDESLKTCPDFELITRMALQFGEDKIITKRGVTMSARNDASSTTYRPESHMQFARDKSTVVRRLLTGDLAPAFTEWLRRDFSYCMHLSSASFIYELTGDSTHYAYHLMEADGSIPGRHEMKKYAAQSRFLGWDEEHKKAYREDPAPPAIPDAAKSAVAKISNLNEFVLTNEWKALGATVTPLPNQQVLIHTVRNEGFSASLQLDFAGLDFIHDWHWLHIQCQGIKGVAKLFFVHIDSGAPGKKPERTIMFQSAIYPSKAPQSFNCFIKPGMGGALMVGNSGIITVERGEQDNQSQIAILSVAMIKMPKP